ncbi:hypothetical protein ACWIUD_01510 [Helicobacter sp. 23-1044]
MKKILLAVFAVFALLNAEDSASDSSENKFIEALKGGEKSGDINLLFDFANSSQRTDSYLATSFGLYYKSDFYGYFRLHLGFRGALPLWEQSRNFQTQGGKGSASKDFWDNNIAMIARSYLEYFDGDTAIKAGRIESKTDMIDKHFDGVWISNNSVGWLLIDAIYVNQFGRVLDRELSGFESFKRYDGKNAGYGGGYYLGATFEAWEWLHFKAYGFYAPRIYAFVAGKAEIETRYFVMDAGFVGGFEDKYSAFRDSATSHLIHADIGGRYDSQYGLFYATAGYRNTHSEAGIGSLNTLGDSFNPFFYFSGNALENARDVHLIYGKLGFKVDFLDIYLAYGYNFFRGDFSRNGSVRNAQGEVDLYFDWRFSKWSAINLYLINTHGAKLSVPNETKFGFMLKLSL